MHFNGPKKPKERFLPKAQFLPKERFLKKTGISILVSVLALTTFLSVPFTGSSFAKEKAEPPEITAKSALVYCQNTGKTVYSKDADLEVSPYSTTKLMTALIVAEKLSPDRKLTVPKLDLDPDESTLKLSEGEEMTVNDMMYGLLIKSGNDCAFTLAKATAGSVDDFVDMMNDKAEELGCKNTHFTNPAGLKDSNHYTTAHDMLLIAKAAMANKTVCKIAHTKRYTIPATNKSDERKLKSHVDLIFTKDSGVTGGKTGYWEDNDCSIVADYSKKNLGLTVILLGDTKKERPKDLEALIKYADETVTGFRAVKKGSCEGRFWIRGGKYTRIKGYAAEDAYGYPKDEKKDSVKTKVNRIAGVKASIRKGDQIAEASVYVNGKKTVTVPVIAKENVQKGSFLSNIYISDRAAVYLFIGVLAIVLIAVLVKRSRKKKGNGGPKGRGKNKRGGRRKNDPERTGKSDSGGRRKSSAENARKNRRGRAGAVPDDEQVPWETTPPVTRGQNEPKRDVLKRAPDRRGSADRDRGENMRPDTAKHAVEGDNAGRLGGRLSRNKDRYEGNHFRGE